LGSDIIKIFDTHCDTVYELCKRGLGFDNKETHINLRGSKKYDTYKQVFAVWSDNKRTPEQNWDDYQKVRDLYNSSILPLKSEAFLPILAVEGGALLNGDLGRLDSMKNDGVTMMTAVWKDDCCIGGAHNTRNGLTSFGRDAVLKMLDIGIVPDVSHASDRMTYEILELAYLQSKPVCASHSNSRTVRSHTRNLTDEAFGLIKKSGGLTGISLCCDHLEDTDLRHADLTSIIRHIEHYMSLGGQDTVCLGCDFDGIDRLPDGFTGLESLPLIKNELIRLNYGEALVDKILYSNADRFFSSL